MFRIDRAVFICMRRGAMIFEIVPRLKFVRFDPCLFFFFFFSARGESNGKRKREKREREREGEGE